MSKKATMVVWRVLSVCGIFLAKVLAAVEYCNSNGDICAQFEAGFNSEALGEMREWWDELEENVKPLKCEFSRREDEEEEEEREQVIRDYRADGVNGPQEMERN